MDEKEVALLSVVLQDSLDKLNILNLLAPSMQQDDPFENDHSEGIPTILNKCHRLFPDNLHNPVVFEDDDSLKWRIFHSGRNYLEDVLKSMLYELRANKSCINTLTNIIEKEKLSKLEDVQSELKKDIREEKLKLLKQELRKVKKDRVINVKQAEERLKHLKKTIQKTKANNLVTEEYCKKHEAVRIERAKKKLKFELEELNDKIEKLKLKIEDESRIHAEVESFCNHEHQCAENELQRWIEKYYKEVREMEKKISDLRAIEETQLGVYEALVEQCNEYKRVLKEDADAKRAERERIELEERRKKSAMMIQCWWRAVMVRRFLGKFRSLKRAIHQRKLKAKALAKAASKKKSKK